MLYTYLVFWNNKIFIRALINVVGKPIGYYMRLA